MPASDHLAANDRDDEQLSQASFIVRDLLPTTGYKRARPSPIATSSSSFSPSRRQHPYDLGTRSSNIYSYSPLGRSLPSSRRFSATSFKTPLGTAMSPKVLAPSAGPVMAEASSSKLSSPSGSLSASSARRRKAPAFPSPRHVPRSAPDTFAFTPTTPAGLRVPATPEFLSSPVYPGYAAPLRGSIQSATALAVPTGMPLHASAPTPTSATRSSLMLEPSPRRPKRSRLEGIPKGYVIKSLNNLAQHFWEHPETSDCTVLVPMLRSQAPPSEPTTPVTADSVHSNQPPRSFWPPTPTIAGVSGHNVVSAHKDLRTRRGSAPGTAEVRVLSFPLHQDYLITQSSLFRALLSPPAHLDLPVTPPLSIKQARILPTPAGTPATVYVPIPDPASFGVLVHWLYWGDTRCLECSLSKGTISWQGLVKNIEYLGIDDRVKRVVGKWWRKWVKVSTGRTRQAGTGLHPVLSRPYEDGSDEGAGDEDNGGEDADGEEEMDTQPNSSPEDEAVASLLNRL